MNGSQVQIPIARPIDVALPPRGGADAEELERVRALAERHAHDQMVRAEVAALVQAGQQAAETGQETQRRQNRAVIARAATQRAKGTIKLVLGIGLGIAVASLVLGLSEES